MIIVSHHKKQKEGSQLTIHPRSPLHGANSRLGVEPAASGTCQQQPSLKATVRYVCYDTPFSVAVWVGSVRPEKTRCRPEHEVGNRDRPLGGRRRCLRANDMAGARTYRR